MIATNLRHSAEISMSLIVGENCYSVREVGPQEIVLSKPADISAGRGELVITIDGDVRKCAVEILDRITADSTEVRYVNGPELPS
jgi:MoaA/NifB/PqqE/SkfB family radical SAM enzyme